MHNSTCLFLWWWYDEDTVYTMSPFCHNLQYNSSFFGVGWTCLLNILLHAIFLWNTSPTGATSNGNLSNLYLPNWHANVVKYDNLSSGFRLWYPELASLRERYFALFSFGKYHYVHPLWTGLKSVWFSITRPRHNLTLSIGLSTNMKLLDHSAASSRQSNVMMSCCCSYSNSSLDGFCRK